MKRYMVTWEIEIDAPDASIAASIARDIQLDPHSLAQTFDVAEIIEETNQSYSSERIDLADNEPTD